MKVFLDTSALFAALDAGASDHRAVARALERSLGSSDVVTTNYVLTETTALVQRRLGVPAVRALVEKVLPLLEVRWIQPYTHRAALDRVVRDGRRRLSFVDCTSFEVMRAEGITEALTLDGDFAREGFRCRPPQRASRTSATDKATR